MQIGIFFIEVTFIRTLPAASISAKNLCPTVIQVASYATVSCRSVPLIHCTGLTGHLLRPFHDARWRIGHKTNVRTMGPFWDEKKGIEFDQSLLQALQKSYKEISRTVGRKYFHGDFLSTDIIDKFSLSFQQWICIRFLLVWFLYKIRNFRSLCIWGKTRGGDTNFSWSFHFPPFYCTYNWMSTLTFNSTTSLVVPGTHCLSLSTTMVLLSM